VFEFNTQGSKLVDHPGERNVRHALVPPTAADTTVVSGKPNLLKVGGTVVGALPECRTERKPRFVKGEGLESILNPSGELGVAEFKCAVGVSFRQSPRKLGG